MMSPLYNLISIYLNHVLRKSFKLDETYRLPLTLDKGQNGMGYKYFLNSYITQCHECEVMNTHAESSEKTEQCNRNIHGCYILHH